MFKINAKNNFTLSQLVDQYDNKIDFILSGQN